MHEPSPGSQLLTNFSIAEYLKSRSQSTTEIMKTSTPRASKFNLDLIVAPLAEYSPKRPFPIIGLENKPRPPTHRRQPSVMIKNISEIYSFTQEISNTDSITEEEVIKYQGLRPKNSLFASTNDARSQFNSLKKSCSEVEEEYFDSENTDLADIYNGVTKPSENFSTLENRLLDDSLNTFNLGILPHKIYCKNCDTEVISEVTIKMPTLPFWKTMCCISNFVNTCADSENIEEFQEFQHKCKRCNVVVAKAYPI